MKLTTYHYYPLILLLFISNITLSMETIFEVEDNSINRSIMQMSSALTTGSEETNLNHAKMITLTLIKDPATWEYMKLLYTSSSKEPVLKELKKLKKEKLVSISKDCDSLDINLYIKKEDNKDENINLLDLCHTALSKKLAKKLDINSPISRLHPNLQKKLVAPLLKEVFKYSNKIIRPSHSYHNQHRLQPSFSPLGNIMISRNKNDGIIYNLKIWETTKELKGHTDYIVYVEISPDETRGFTGSKDQTVKIWNTTSGNCLHTLNYNSIVTAMACNNNTTQLACGYTDGTVKIWNIADGACLYTFEHLLARNKTEGIKAVAFNKTGTQIITADFYAAKIYCTETGRCIKTLIHPDRNHQNEITAIAFSSDDTKAVTGSLRYAFLWDLTTDECIGTFGTYRNHYKYIETMQECWINSVELSKDGKRLYTIISKLGTPRHVWDTKTEKLLGSIGHSIYSDFQIPTNNLYHNELIKYLYSDPAEKEKKKFNNQLKESITLIRTLWISHMYRKYIKNNEIYHVQPNSEVYIMLQSMMLHDNHLGAYSFLLDTFFINIIADNPTKPLGWKFFNNLKLIIFTGAGIVILYFLSHKISLLAHQLFAKL